MAKKEALEQIVNLEMDLIDRPQKVARLEINEEHIKELADSIKERGQLQAIRVSKKGGRYEIIFGDRRYLATKSLGRDTIKAVIVSMNEKDILVDRAIENIQKVDLTPLEEAEQYQLLIEKMGVTYDKIAKVTGKTPGTVKRRLHILKMPAYMQAELHKGRISVSVAEELQDCPDEATKQYFVEMAADHGLTKTVARQWVADYRKSLRAPGGAGGDTPPPQFHGEPEPIFTACFLCKGPVDVMKALRITVCPVCGKQLIEVLEK